MSKITTLKLGFSNAFLLEDKKLILVDTGINVSQEKFRQVFSDLNINPKWIDLIVISHGHTDHFAHVKYLKELTGAPLLCHKNAVAALQTGKNPEIIARNQLGRDVLRRLRFVELPSYQPVEPDILIEKEFDLNSYGVAGRIIPTPGHSDCSLSLVLDTGEALIGDLVISSPFTGKPCLAYFATDEKALFASINKLLNEVHTFYSAHGGPFTREEVLSALARTQKQKKQ